MKLRIFLRPALSVVFGFLGAFIAKTGTPPEIFEVTGDYFLIVAVASFGVFGFILPDILELAGKAGIAALSSQIVKSLPRPQRRKKNNIKGAKYLNPLVIDTS